MTNTDRSSIVIEKRLLNLAADLKWQWEGEHKKDQQKCLTKLKSQTKNIENKYKYLLRGIEGKEVSNVFKLQKNNKTFPKYLQEFLFQEKNQN